MLPLARHLQARPLQGGNHRGAIRDGPRFDALAQIVGNQPPGVFLCLQPSPKLGGFDVGPMAALHVPCPLRIVRTAPPVLVVLPVPQCVKRLLPSRSRDIQALAGLKIAARRQDMHVDPTARFSVLDSRPGVAVRFQPRPGGFLELVQHAANLRIARFVLRCPRDDARRVLVLELKRIGHLRHLVRIAPQVQQRVHLHGGLAPAELGPREQREAQVDGGRVQSVETLIETHADRIAGVQGPRDANQDLGEIGIDPPVARLVGVGQCGARHRGAESHVVELGAERTQARFDVAQAFAVGQLGKRHA